ncbi:MAG: ABC transporter ATP-binding protein [Anaerolineales bacterium]|nr:ABC transporter ATP-binding protein [Anaerolineales bacterium]
MLVNETNPRACAANQLSDQQAMPADDIAISVSNLTKKYRIFGHPGDRIKQALTLGRMRFHREFTALQDVSFEIKKGETVGIVGRNGSGKSTLLQLICGILKPTSGSVKVNGRISALLELGAGFNPEFTGRENAYFQGAVMGMTREEMDGRFDDIAAFADIGEFIDQPVRIYSSGMFVRLAFAVAVHVSPDILIIDEVLAVGDAVFQKKCFDLIYKLQSQGTSIIVVSHDPYQIERLCHKAAIMQSGNLSELKPAKEILLLYHEMTKEEMPQTFTRVDGHREGAHELYFENIFVNGASSLEPNVVLATQPLYITADVMATHPMDNVRFRFEICSSSHEVVTELTTIGLSEDKQFNGRHRVLFSMDSCPLTSGWYYINAMAGRRNMRLDTFQHATEFKVLLKNKDALNLSQDQGVFISQGQWDFVEAE